MEIKQRTTLKYTQHLVQILSDNQLKFIPAIIVKMKFSIEIKYYHPELKIGLENIKEAWLLSDMKHPIELKTVITRETYIIASPVQVKE